MTSQPTYSLSISDAAKRGVSGLARDADIFQVLSGLAPLHRDLAVVLIRTATDTGERTSLDDVIMKFGFNRTTLEHELDEDLAAGRA